MAFFGLFGDSSDVPPPMTLGENEELTEAGYLISRNSEGEPTSIVNWQDHCQQVERIQEEMETSWLSKLFR